jgi:hypothetical protein
MVGSAKLGWIARGIDSYVNFVTDEFDEGGERLSKGVGMADKP